MAGKHENLIPTRYSLLSRLENWDDQQSWRDFFDAYWRLIYGTATQAGLSEAEAQDVVQETVICVAKDIQKFKRDKELGSFKGWLRNIIRWRINDQLRKRLPAGADRSFLSEAEPNATLPESLPDAAISVLDAHWEQEWEQNLLHAALDQIKTRVKEEYLQIFDLYVLKKWPVRKVAETLGVRVGQVYLASHRVGVLIKKEMRELEKNLF